MNADPVLTLMRSLSRPEKRYLGLYARRFVFEKESLSLRLFQYLEAHPEADTHAQRSWLAQQSRTAKLENLRHALYELLLDGLRAYHQDRSPASWFRRQMDQIELLYQRGETGLCARRVQQVHKRLAQYDFPEMLLELNRWELRLLKRNPGAQDAAVYARLQAVEAACLAQMTWESQLRSLHDQLYAILQETGAAQVPAADITGMLDIPAMQVPPEALAFEGQVIRLYVQVWAGLLRGEEAQVYAAYRTLYAVWQSRPLRLRGEPLRFLRAFRSLVEHALTNHDHAPIPGWFRELERYERDLKMDAGLILQFRHYLEVKYALETADCSRIRPLLPELRQRLSRPGHALPAPLLQAFLLNLTSLHFVLEQPREALRLLQHLQHLPESRTREDMLRYARIMHLLLHYALGNEDLLDTMLTRAARLPAQEPAPGAAELLLHAHLRRALDASPLERRHLLSQLDTALRDLSPAEQNRTGAHEIRLWASAQATGQGLQSCFAQQQRV